MNRRGFLQVSVPASLGLAAAVHSGAQRQSPASWTIANNRLKIVLAAETKAGLSGFIDLQSKRNFIARPGPLYRLQLFQKGQDLMELSSLEAESFTAERSLVGKDETLTLTYGGHQGLDITIICTVQLPPDSPLSKWRISVKNNSLYGIRAIQYPVVQAPLSLGDSAEDDYFASPKWGGNLSVKPGRSMTPRDRAKFRADGGRSPTWLLDQYPGPVSMQMQAYYDRTAGIYMATHDGAGNIKHFGLTRSQEALDVSMEHNYDERPGFSFQLPYDTVLGVFRGDWHTAGDIYKGWAVQQSWCARKTVDRGDIPAWLKEPRPVLMCECRGFDQRVRGGIFPPSDYPLGRFWPAKKVIPLTRKYASIFGTPVTVWYNGWEKFGDKCGPVDIFPPLEGAGSLKAAMEELSHEGYNPFIAVWGMHWCYKRNMAGYDGWAHFENDGRPLAALNDREAVSRYVDGNMEIHFVPVCVGNHASRQLYTEWFSKLMDLGAVALEFDHSVGGLAAVCYSHDHGHPPGYGIWMHDGMRDFLRHSRQMARSRNRDSILSGEGVCETWIQDLDLMLNRPYSMNGIPLFTYVYHEYIPLAGGDGRIGVSHPETELMLHALNFAYGNQSLVMVGLPDYDFEVNPNYPVFALLKNLFEAQRTYAHAYLALGQMLKPPALETSNIVADVWLPPGKEQVDPPTVEIPAVRSSAWRSPEGKTGFVLVNWTCGPERVGLGPLQNDGPVFLVTAAERRPVPAESVNSGRITLTVPGRSVVLVEQG